MIRCKGSIGQIETMGLYDGPGLRTVVFMNGCKLRCKYCHNPEMWAKKENNYTVNKLVKQILKNKEYFNNNGGVTFSGGEPLLQSKFLLKVVKKLKKYNIHITIDTAGVAPNYKKLLKYVDLILLDIKHINKEKYKELTGHDMNEFLNFINYLNKINKKIWIRQVILPNLNDNEEYMKNLKEFLKQIKNVEKVEFLPYHTLGIKKYKDLGINYPLKNIEAMNKEKCELLYNYFQKLT